MKQNNFYYETPPLKSQYNQLLMFNVLLTTRPKCMKQLLLVNLWFYVLKCPYKNVSY